MKNVQLIGKLIAVLLVTLIPGMTLGQGGGMGAGAAFNAYQNQAVAATQQANSNSSELIAVEGVAVVQLSPKHCGWCLPSLPRVKHPRNAQTWSTRA